MECCTISSCHLTLAMSLLIYTWHDQPSASPHTSLASLYGIMVLSSHWYPHMPRSIIFATQVLECVAQKQNKKVFINISTSKYKHTYPATAKKSPPFPPEKNSKALLKHKRLGAEVTLGRTFGHLAAVRVPAPHHQTYWSSPHCAKSSLDIDMLWCTRQEMYKSPNQTEADNRACPAKGLETLERGKEKSKRGKGKEKGGMEEKIRERGRKWGGTTCWRRKER